MHVDCFQFQLPDHTMAVIIDAMAMLQMLVRVPDIDFLTSQTWYLVEFWNRLEATRIDFVGDQYPDISIKNSDTSVAKMISWLSTSPVLSRCAHVNGESSWLMARTSLVYWNILSVRGQPIKPMPRRLMDALCMSLMGTFAQRFFPWKVPFLQAQLLTSAAWCRALSGFT